MACVCVCGLCDISRYDVNAHCVCVCDVSIYGMNAYYVYLCFVLYCLCGVDCMCVGCMHALRRGWSWGGGITLTHAL